MMNFPTKLPKNQRNIQPNIRRDQKRRQRHEEYIKFVHLYPKSSDRTFIIIKQREKNFRLHILAFLRRFSHQKFDGSTEIAM